MTATGFTDYLDARDPSFEGVRQRVVTLLLNRSALPSFSASTSRLFRLCQSPNTDVAELAAVIALDPALAMRCIRAASTFRYGTRQITSINDAILATGMRNVLQIGAAMCDLIGAPLPAVLAVRFHHEPLLAECVEHPESGHGLLAALLAVANAAAKLMQAGFENAEPVLPLAELPEFHYLGQFERSGDLELNVTMELQRTEEDLQALMPGRK